MKYIRLINPKNETVFVKEIQVVISEVLYNPANYINFAEWDVINVNPCKNAFKSIEDAFFLNANNQLRVLSQLMISEVLLSTKTDIF